MAEMVFLRRRRLTVFLATVVAVFATMGTARVEQDPCDALAGETIRWIVPFGAGGGYDLHSRILEPFLEARLGAEVVVVNVIGAGGNVGAKQLQRAKPDGRTLGIIHGSTLLVSELFGAGDGPSLPGDFTLLGRLGRVYDVWAVADKSRIRTMDNFFTNDSGRNFVLGVPSVGSKHWLTGVIVSELLGFEVDFIFGYKGSKDRTLGLLRGEFDVIGTTASSAIPRVEAGEMRLLILIGEAPVGHEQSLRDVPRLGGPDGLAARRARALGRDPGEANSRAEALARIMAAGRLVAAPPGMDPSLKSCLEERVFDAMTDADFGAAMMKVGHQLDLARGANVAASLLAAKRQVASFIPIVREGDEKAGQ